MYQTVKVSPGNSRQHKHLQILSKKKDSCIKTDTKESNRLLAEKARIIRQEMEDTLYIMDFY